MDNDKPKHAGGRPTKTTQETEPRARARISDINVWCRFDEAVDVVNLIENPRNPNKHPDKQIALLAKIIRNQGWRQPITVSKRSGFIVKGHGRLQAAKVLQVEQVPVEFQEYESEAAEYADLIADNRIAELAEPDMEEIAALLNDAMFTDFDMDLTGFDKMSICELDLEESGLDNKYASKIEAPVYEPKNEKPKVSDLLSSEKAIEFIKEIESADIPKEEKEFLIAAARRHIVFDYGKIADYYAHSNEVVQDLMEKSALIIIDFDKAIVNGYVKMSKDVADLYAKEYPDE